MAKEVDRRRVNHANKSQSTKGTFSDDLQNFVVPTWRPIPRPRRPLSGRVFFRFVFCHFFVSTMMFRETPGPSRNETWEGGLFCGLYKTAIRACWPTPLGILGLDGNFLTPAMIIFGRISLVFTRFVIDHFWVGCRELPLFLHFWIILGPRAVKCIHNFFEPSQCER